MGNNMKFDLNDIVIKPTILSDIESRSEINLTELPLFVAPMDSVVDNNNIDKFIDVGYKVAFPRNEIISDEKIDDVFVSVGIKEAKEMLEIGNFPKKLLIDVANGHMISVYNIAKSIKEKHPNVILMVGNIANPDTYAEYAKIGVDFLRCGVGGGSSCTTSANTGIHYPMASLINECYIIKDKFNFSTKIVADGGFKNFDEVIKALALGADYVMLGGILSKCLEACSSNYIKAINSDDYVLTHTEYKKEDLDDINIYKKYRGMSTKEVQKKWNKDNNLKLKTAEGISFYTKVEYTLNGWTENFTDYLKSAMSYTGKREIKDFKGGVDYIHITDSAQKRYKK